MKNDYGKFDEFIPYEQSLELKEIGFNEPCIASYSQHFNALTGNFDVLEQNGFIWQTITNESLKEYEKACTAPLYQQAFRWFREKYEIFSCIMTEYSYGGHVSAYHINGKRQSGISKGDFATYEEAELACLRKIVELVKQK